jgi:erythromycin esterase
MRTWNRTHARRVKFYGFDMQFPAEAALDVLDYLECVAPQMAAASATALQPLCNDFSAGRFGFLPEATRAEALAEIEHLERAFARERAAWVVATGALEWHLARLSLKVLGQSAGMQILRLDPKSAPISPRDVPMADNIAALLEAEGPDAKAVVWAHNGHVEREQRHLTHDGQPDANMGTRLHELLGAKHLVVGFAFNRGSFQALGPDGVLVSHTVGPAPEGSLDGLLAKAEMPLLLLPTATAPEAGPVADWLGARPPARCIGAGYLAEHADHYLAPTDPRRSYDVLAFVATTTAARPNASGRRQPVPLRVDLVPAPVNLALAGSGGVPEGWRWSGARAGYRLAPSREPSPAGGRSVSIARASAPWRWGQATLEQDFSAEPWRGRRLRFSAAVRTEVHGHGAQIMVEICPSAESEFSSRRPSSIAVLDLPVRSPHWGRYEVVIDVPETAYSLTIGLALFGNGEAWFGDLEVAGEAGG